MAKSSESAHRRLRARVWCLEWVKFPSPARMGRSLTRCAKKGEPKLVDIPDSLLVRLKKDIVNRRIGSGLACLEEHESSLACLDPRQRNAGPLVGYLAQWVDIGFDRPARVKELLLRFTAVLRADLSLSSYIYLRMAEGMLAMAEEASSEALAHFDVVLALGQDLQDKETLAVASFWKARCLRKKGEYNEAFDYTFNARKLALELGHPKMAAVMSVLESWLLFQKGKSKTAERILREAQEELCATDDYITLANIYSSYGRMARREGRYDDAIEHFTKAIEECRKRGLQHPHLARSLANMALVKRLASLHLGKKIDARVERRRKSGTRAQATKRSSIDHRSALEHLRQEAVAHLDEARAIYEHHGSHHGAGTVRLIYGYLYLDDGDLDHAESEAEMGFRLAQEKNDYIIMSRVRLLQCMIENSKLEEEIGEQSDQEVHARSAVKFAHEAIEFAKQTQNRRLLANAYVWEGLSYCNEVLDDPDAARRFYNLALPFVKGDEAGQLWDDLHSLRARIVRTEKVDARLRAWSQGSVGEKSFQHILEEFSELIISKIWESEGRKISRVAKRLSISPKKVRRVLGRVGGREKTRREV